LNYFDNGFVQLRHGDCRDVLASMDAGSVQTCVTSPPYWGLRDYGLEPVLWDGDADCEHEWGQSLPKAGKVSHGQGGSTLTGGHESWENRDGGSQGRNCACGAWRGCLGLEPTPELYVQHIVEVFRAVWRVLRDDGTLWLNLGSSYASSASGNPTWEGWQTGGVKDASKNYNPRSTVTDGFKAKDLIPTDWLCALALQADGWYLRSAITLCKRAPMPESVTDRPTNATEMMFLLTKKPRYFYDQEAVREPNKPESEERYRYALDGSYTPGTAYPNEKRDKPQQWKLNPSGRNLWNYWVITPSGSADAHYATFSADFVEKPILAGTPEKGACAACGAPWERVVEKGFTSHSAQTATTYPTGMNANRLALLRQAARGTGREYVNESTTTRHRPACDCNAATEPATVLDPFGGSGTTGVIAQKLGRRAVLIDAKEEYLKMAKKRLERIPMPMRL
jgi:DNA modification methylase